jgi:hypothetical protein
MSRELQAEATYEEEDAYVAINQLNINKYGAEVLVPTRRIANSCG